MGESVSAAGAWLRKILPFATVLALSLAIAWLFDNFDLIRDTPVGPAISYLYFPGAMFSVYFVCGLHDDTIPNFICYFAGVFLETLVIWLILRAIWRLARGNRVTG